MTIDIPSYTPVVTLHGEEDEYSRDVSANVLAYSIVMEHDVFDYHYSVLLVADSLRLLFVFIFDLGEIGLGDEYSEVPHFSTDTLPTYLQEALYEHARALSL